MSLNSNAQNRAFAELLAKREGVSTGRKGPADIPFGPGRRANANAPSVSRPNSAARAFGSAQRQRVAQSHSLHPTGEALQVARPCFSADRCSTSTHHRALAIEN
eukprot:4092181-Pleurochrysis_carterae.AAC.2